MKNLENLSKEELINEDWRLRKQLGTSEIKPTTDAVTGEVFNHLPVEYY